MHPIATELNDILRGTVVEALLSDVGQRMFFPKGIVAQAAEAAHAGVRHNATQGIATVNGEPYALPSVARHYAHLSSAQIVSYAPTGGIVALRERWRTELRAKNSALSDNYSLPVVTGGITNAISTVAELFANADDALVAAAPYWGNYRLIFAERRAARIIPYDIFSAHGGHNIAMLRDALRRAAAGSGDSAKVLCIFNFPHNPTGYTATTKEAQDIIDALIECAEGGTRIAVLCDDAYFGLQYESGLMEQSLFARLADSHQNILAIKLDGATKEEFAWGFRVGFVTFASKGLRAGHYRALEKKAFGVVRSTLSNCNVAAQHIIHAALDSPTHQQEKQYFYDLIVARYRKVKQVLAAHGDHARLTSLPFNSGYFVTFRCRDIDTERLRTELLKQDIGIVAIDATHIRVTYSTIDIGHIAEVFDKIFDVADTIG